MLIAKANPPGLRKWIKARFDEPQWLGEAPPVAESLGGGHGRIERRKLQVSSAPSDHELWPGLEPVFAMGREVRQPKSGRSTQEVVCGRTGLSKEQASAKEPQRFARGHWTLENRSHWVRESPLMKVAARCVRGTSRR